MNCTEFEHRLNEQLDARALDETPDMAGHIAECEPCRVFWESAQTLSDAISHWRNETPDVDLGSAVLARRALENAAAPAPQRIVRTPSPSPVRPRTTRLAQTVVLSQTGGGAGDAAARTRWTLVASLAAMAALLALSAVPSFEDPAEIAARRSLSGSHVVSRSERPNHDRKTTIPLPLEDDGPYATLGKQASGVLAVLVPGTATSGTTPAAGMPGGKDDSWLGGLQSQWQPVGESLGNALDFLWQAGDAHDSART